MLDMVVINEASLPFSTGSNITDSLLEFFKIISKSNAAKISLVRTTGDNCRWDSYVYADDFHFGKWLNEIGDIDLTRMVKKVLSDVECGIQFVDPATWKLLEGRIYYLTLDPNILVDSLGVASYLEIHAISFKTDSKWCVNPIEITEEIQTNDKWNERKIDVLNISNSEQFQQFLDAALSAKQETRKYLKSLENINEEFQNIEIFDNALKAFKASSVSVVDGRDIVHVLKQLNSSIVDSNSLTQLQECSGLNISGESQATMTRPKYARQRNFKNLNNTYVCCELHIKNFHDGKRMHISADYEMNTVSIGYFGKHLPTASKAT